MKNPFPFLARYSFLVTALALAGCSTVASKGVSRHNLEIQARHAFHDLVRENPAAANVARQSLAVLVFPSVIKGGFLYGGQTGNGVLFRGGRAVGFYNTSAVSYGLQAGLQDYGYALFFMNEGALSYLNKSAGFELGVGPSLVVADAGFAKSYTSTTLTQDVYAFAFKQRGLMAGLGITGSKITPLAH